MDGTVDGATVGRRTLLAHALGAAAAFAITTTAFVAHRNHAFEKSALERAAESVAALAEGREPLAPPLAGGIVTQARPSKKYPFLHRRTLASPKPRGLGGPAAPAEDKILADAATRAEREGAFVRFLADGSGRIVAARPAASGGIAVVLVAPLGRPARYPFLVVGGLLLLGAVVAAISARLVTAWGKTTLLGVSMATLAPPAAIWGGPVAAGAVLATAMMVAIADHRGLVARAAHAASEHRVAYTYLLPAAIGMAVLVLVPLVVGTAIGFFDHSRGEWHYVGLANFAAILSGDGRALTDPLNFWFTLAVTIAWTSVNVAMHVTIGVVLALALRERWMRWRGLFRVLLILPWAVPNYITALIWRGMFQRQYGAVNHLLDAVGLDKIAWFSQFATAFTANVTTNTWLGFPFMMVVALGALESIPRDLYEASAVDGANAWQRFWHITLPNLRPALLPAVVLGSIWTFNMFNVIYLVSGGKPAGATDILVTQAYRWAFERGQRYGMAAAYATIIFLILVVWTLLANRLAAPRESRA